MTEMSAQTAIARLLQMDPEDRVDLRELSEAESVRAPGANYRVTARIPTNAGVKAILEALAEHAGDGSGVFTPEVELRARLNDDEVTAIRERGAISAQVHYVPSQATEPHPVPVDTINQALMTIGDLLTAQEMGSQWQAKRVQTISGDALHRTCVMLTEEWIRPHSAYPHRPNVEVPRGAATDAHKYLEDWGIKVAEIMERR